MNDRQADFILTSDPSVPPRFTQKQLDTPISVAQASEIIGWPARTLRTWIEQGSLAASAPTSKRGDRLVTLRGVLFAEAKVFESDTRPEQLRKPR